MREQQHRPQRRRLPAGDGAGDRRRQAVGCDRRPLRPSRPRRSRQHARRQETTPDKIASRRRRQRVGIGRRPGDRRRRWRSSRATATCCSASGRAKSSGCSARRRSPPRRRCRSIEIAALPQLRHGRPDAGQQAHGAGDRHEPGVGEDPRAGQRRRRLRPAPCRQIRISRPTSRRFNAGERAVPELLHRHARRLSQAVATPPTRSTTRISIASPTSRRRSPGASRIAEPAPAVHEGRAADCRAAAAAPGVRVFTGTIPDYAGDVKGLLLGGVIGGGPGRTGRAAARAT